MESIFRSFFCAHRAQHPTCANTCIVKNCIDLELIFFLLLSPGFNRDLRGTFTERASATRRIPWYKKQNPTPTTTRPAQTDVSGSFSAKIANFPTKVVKRKSRTTSTKRIAVVVFAPRSQTRRSLTGGGYRDKSRDCKTFIPLPRLQENRGRL